METNSNRISELLLEQRSIIRPLLEKISKSKVEEVPKIQDLNNLGSKYKKLLRELEEKINSESDKNKEKYAICYEVLKGYLPPRSIKQSIKHDGSNREKKNETKDISKVTSAERLSNVLVRKFDKKEFGVVSKIFELCKQARIYPIEFDRLFFLIGSGRYEGIGNLGEQDFKPECIGKIKKDFDPFGKGRVHIYKHFFSDFKDKTEGDFTFSVFEQMKEWLIKHYNQGLKEKKISMSDIDSFITHPYVPSLLEGNYPSEEALVEHLIKNRYASGAPSSDASKSLTIEALQRHFKLEENLSLEAMKERASLFVKEDRFSSLSLTSEKGKPGNLTKDIELLFSAFEFIHKQCNGLMANFYNKISMKEQENNEDFDSFKESFIELVEEITKWKNYGIPLSANFIKDYQLVRELRDVTKENWKNKFAAYTAKPDLHLINFTSLLSNKKLLNQFLSSKLT